MNNIVFVKQSCFQRTLSCMLNKDSAGERAGKFFERYILLFLAIIKEMNILLEKVLFGI